MKIITRSILILVYLLCGTSAQAAARFYVTGGSTTNWGDTANWSLTSGGAGGQAVPTTSDACTFDANSTANVVLDTSARTCGSIVFTNYTHTITFTNNLTIQGSVTLGASMTFAGASSLIINATGTLTSNGKAVTVPLQLIGSSTFTLADTWTVNATATLSAGSNIAINSNGINLGGSFDTGTGGTSGSATLTVTGTGTWTASGNGPIQNNLTINTGGTLTVSGNVYFNTGTLLYTAGTVTTTGSTLNITNASTLNCAGITWNNLTWGTGFSATVTAAANVNIAGNFTFGGAGRNDTFAGTFDWNVGGNLTLNGDSSTQINVASGTPRIVLNGTGTWSQPGGGRLEVNTNINTSGTVTLSGTIRYDTTTLSYTAGTIALASSPLFTVAASTTFNMGGKIIGGLSDTTAGTIITLSSDLGISGTLTLNGTNASAVQIKSNSGGTLRKLTVASGTNEDVIYTNPTDIDSRDGVPVYYAKGTTSNTFNWIGTNPGQAKNGGVLVINGGNTTVSSNPGMFIQ